MKKKLLGLLLLAATSMGAWAQTSVDKDGVTYSAVAGTTTSSTETNTTSYAIGIDNALNGQVSITENKTATTKESIPYTVTPSAYGKAEIELKSWSTEPTLSASTNEWGSAKSYLDDNADFATYTASAIAGSDEIISLADVKTAGGTKVTYDGDEYVLAEQDADILDILNGYAYYVDAKYNKIKKTYTYTYIAIIKYIVTPYTSKQTITTKEYTLSSSLPKIADTNVTKLILPNSITTIEDGAITALTSLESLSASCAPVLDSRYVFNSTKTQLIAVLTNGSTEEVTYTLPETTATIAQNALVNVSNITLVASNDELTANVGTYTSSFLGGTNNKLTVLKLSQDVSTDGKGIIVTGRVTSSNIGSLDFTGVYANKCYVDFTSATIGENITVTPANNMIYYFPASDDYTVSGDYNIVTGIVNYKGKLYFDDATCTKFVLTDNSTKDGAKEIYIPYGFTAKKAVVKRNFTKDRYATMILPFALSETNCSFLNKMNATGDTIIRPAMLDSWNNNMIYFKYGTTQDANTPLLVHAKQTVSEIATDDGMDVEVKATTSAPYSTVKDNATFTGIYDQKTSWNADEYFFNAYLTIKRGTGATSNYVNPMRAWLTLPGVGSAKVAFLDELGELVGDDNTVTAVEHVDGNAEVVDAQYFDLNGKKVSEDAKGTVVVKTTYTDGTSKTVKKVNK